MIRFATRRLKGAHPNLWLPFLAVIRLLDPARHQYTVYNINLTDNNGTERVLQKRFNEFHTLYQQLRGAHAEVA